MKVETDINKSILNKAIDALVEFPEVDEDGMCNGECANISESIKAHLEFEGVKCQVIDVGNTKYKSIFESDHSALYIPNKDLIVDTQIWQFTNHDGPTEQINNRKIIFTQEEYENLGFHSKQLPKINKNNMKNYYTHIGNIIKEGGAEFEIIGHKPTSLTIKKKSNIEKDLPEHDLSFSELPDLMASKKIIVSKCENDILCDLPYENERDKVLLQNEITTIELSHKNKNLSSKNEELHLGRIKKSGKAKKLKADLKEKEDAFKDTTEAIEAIHQPKPMGYAEKKMAIRMFLKQFPLNAKDWGQATQEVVDLHKYMTDIHREDSYAGKKKYNFDWAKESKTPAIYNTRHRKGIEKLLNLMSENGVEQTYNHYKDWFDNAYTESPKSKKQNKIEYLNGIILPLFPDAIVTIENNRDGDDIVYVNGHTAFNLSDVHGMSDETNRKNAMVRAYNSQNAGKGTRGSGIPKAKGYKEVSYLGKTGFKEQAKLKKKLKKGPLRGKTTLSERKYIREHSKDFNALKDAYPTATFKELISKHKSANTK